MSSANAPDRCIRTLIVDDDAVARRLHSDYVRGVNGFSVVAAVGEGHAAIGWVAGGEVDLVLLDIGLPRFSGIEVLHQIRTVARQPVDVIVVSSLRDRVTVRQALSGQVRGYLVKPFTRAAMVQRLEQFRDERSARQPAELDTFGQGEIDDLIGRRTGSATDVPSGRPANQSASEPGAADRTRLPKGLSTPTLAAIVAVLEGGGGHTAAEVAQASGASRATVRRYLDHLHRTGAVDVSHRYGGRGRPELIYRLS